MKQIMCWPELGPAGPITVTPETQPVYNLLVQGNVRVVVERPSGFKTTYGPYLGQ